MDYGRARGQLDVTVVLSVRASLPWSPQLIVPFRHLIVHSYRCASANVIIIAVLHHWIPSPPFLPTLFLLPAHCHLSLFSILIYRATCNMSNVNEAFLHLLPQFHTTFSSLYSAPSLYPL